MRVRTNLRVVMRAIELESGGMENPGASEKRAKIPSLNPLSLESPPVAPRYFTIRSRTKKFVAPTGGVTR